MTPLIDGEIVRECQNCGETKSLEDFNFNKQCSKGRTRTCKSCTSAKRTTWYKDNRSRRQYAANKRNRDRKKLVVEHFGDRCADCKQSYQQCVYEFHHLDPNQKDYNPSKSMSHSLERMWAELDKCIMVCSNCHKIRHWGSSEKGR